MRIIDSQPVNNNSYYQQPTIGQIGAHYGSYGNNNPYNQYNPYNNLMPGYYQEQEKLRQEQLKNDYDNFNAIQRMLENSIAKYNNRDPKHDEPTPYEDYVKEQNKINAKEEEYNHICSLDALFREEEERRRLYSEELIRQAEEANKDTRGLLEFFETSGNERLKEMREQEIYKCKHNVKALYNSNAYNSLLGLTANPIFGEKMDIDDVNITLPSSLINDYAQKRAAFMRMITSGGNDNG